MKKERAFISSICILLIVLGLIFSSVYLNFYISNTRHIINLVFAFLAIAESMFIGLSFYFYLSGLKNKFVIIIYVVSIFLTIPILLFALFWFLYLAGIQIVPPPQQ